MKMNKFLAHCEDKGLDRLMVAAITSRLGGWQDLEKKVQNFREFGAASYYENRLSYDSECLEFFVDWRDEIRHAFSQANVILSTSEVNTLLTKKPLAGAVLTGLIWKLVDIVLEYYP